MKVPPGRKAGRKKKEAELNVLEGGGEDRFTLRRENEGLPREGSQ